MNQRLTSADEAQQPPTMYLRQAGLTRNPTFRIFNAFAVGDSTWLRKPRSNANTHVAGKPSASWTGFQQTNKEG
jgi:hypothetical protein